MASDIRGDGLARAEDPLPPPDAPHPTGAQDSPGRSDWRTWLRRMAVPLLVVTAAGILRFDGLGHPDRIYFDETYYAEDAAQLLERGVEDGFAVHPPIGKWLIATGIAVLGDNPVGWRSASAVAGTLIVLMVYLAGLRLFRRGGIAALAALLIAVDGMAFTMSRIAMLDVFVALFITAGFWLLLCDRDAQWAVVPPALAADGAEGEPVGPHRLPQFGNAYRWLAGLAFGLAVATKWSGLLAIGAAGLFVLVSELLWRRRVAGTVLAAPGRLVLRIALPLVLLPALVYVVSYAGWFANFANTRPGGDQCTMEPCQVPLPQRASAWLGEQQEILQFHMGLDAEHSYRANASTWPLLNRPVAYYYESCREDRAPEDGPCQVAEGNVAEILGIGNPAIWWLAVPVYGLLAFAAVYWRRWQAAAILVFLLGQYLPWLIASRPLFLFYTAPIVPFICLALAWACWEAMRYRRLAWAPAAVGVIAVAGFLFWHPLFVGTEIEEGAWRFRMLMRSWY